MAVKTKITLHEVNKLFVSFNFIKLVPTTSGIVDTTYIAITKNREYILKKYERDIEDRIKKDTKLLKKLKNAGLNVPTLLESKNEWFLYEKLRGNEPKVVKIYHIQALARFLAKLHSITYDKTKGYPQKDEISKALKFTKDNFFLYYKKLEFLKSYKPKNDGFIHGDIFKDNTVFDTHKLGIFDFIDGDNGSFYFDIAVALVSFDAKKHNFYFINLFLNTYNQHSPKKLNKEELLKHLHIASSFYALKRILSYKNTKKAKELL